MNESDSYLPWPLAWHPSVPDDTLDPARFSVPQCGSQDMRYQRINGGLWTSPMITRHYSAWSIQHDVDNMSAHQVREGWALDWPDPARTAVVDSLADLTGLVARFPCRAHRSLHAFFMTGARCTFDELDSDLYDRPMHDDMLFPPLDFPAMAQVYDAFHVTAEGIRNTRQTVPGTTAWAVQTVLWLKPVWRVLHPIATLRYDASRFADAFVCSCTFGTSAVCELS